MKGWIWEVRPEPGFESIGRLYFIPKFPKPEVTPKYPKSEQLPEILDIGHFPYFGCFCARQGFSNIVLGVFEPGSIWATLMHKKPRQAEKYPNQFAKTLAGSKIPKITQQIPNWTTTASKMPGFGVFWVVLEPARVFALCFGDFVHF